MLLEIPIIDQRCYSHETGGYIDLNINPDAIAAQDVKLMSSLIGAAYGFGIPTATVDAAYLALNQTIAKAIKEGIDPYTELLPLNLTSVGNHLSPSLLPLQN